jgi:hypothetical protein
MAAVLLLASAIVLALVLVYVQKQREKRQRIPPGAKPLPGPRGKQKHTIPCINNKLADHWPFLAGLPLIGRIHDVPAEMTWMKFHEWGKKYGPIYQMEIFGSVHVWISSEEIAHELLGRRAAIYSDRPTIANLPTNRTAGEYLALHGNNGEALQLQRKQPG